MRRWFQSPGSWPVVAVVWAGSLAAVAVEDGPWAPRLDHPAIRHTALLAAAFWAVGVALHLTAGRGALRAVWAFGWLMLLVHIAAAFHLGHGWSHAAAFEHTERTAGVGEGVYVNDLVALVWGLDAIWLALWPDRYAWRPRWVGWAVHGFLAFVMFNATVVYGTGIARWGGAAAFAVLGWLAVLANTRH